MSKDIPIYRMSVSSLSKQWLTQWQDYWSLYQGNSSYLVLHHRFNVALNKIKKLLMKKLLCIPATLQNDQNPPKIYYIIWWMTWKKKNFTTEFFWQWKSMLFITTYTLWDLIISTLWRSSLFLVCWKHHDIF